MAAEAASEETTSILEKPAECTEKGQSIPLTAFNIANIILGASVVSLPWCLAEGGYGTSFILFFIFAVSSGYTLSLLVSVSESRGTTTYQDTVRETFGQPGFFVVGSILVINGLIDQSAYTISITDNLSKVVQRLCRFDDIDELRTHIWGTRAFLAAAPLVFVVIPLSSMKNIGYMAKWAVLSMIAISFTVILLSVRLGTLDVPKTENAYSFAGNNILGAFGVLAFAFLCHDNTFTIYATLHEKSLERWNKSVGLAFTISTVALVSLATLGYAIFTGHSQANIFENFCSDDDLANGGRMIYVINIMLTSPCNIYITRQVLTRTFLQGTQLNETVLNIMISVLCSAVVYGVAMSTECMGIVIEVAGIGTATPLLFIFPALLAIKADPDKVVSVRNIPKILIVIIAITLQVAGLANIIIEISQGQTGCYKGQEPDYCFPRNATIIVMSYTNVSTS